MMGSWISEFVSIIFVNENLPAALIVCWQVFYFVSLVQSQEEKDQIDDFQGNVK